MPSQQQLTGMRGVYLVAAELTRLGFIASPTSRSAIGADILVTDQGCQRSYSVQVKTNARTFNFWLLSKKAKELVSDTHIYVFVNLRRDAPEYFVVPSREVAKNIVHEPAQKSEWWSIYRSAIESYRDNWAAFGAP